jgi:hypothetical protein
MVAWLGRSLTTDTSVFLFGAVGVLCFLNGIFTHYACYEVSECFLVFVAVVVEVVVLYCGRE